MNKRSRCGHSIDTGKGQTILNVSLSDSSKYLSIFFILCSHVSYKYVRIEKKLIFVYL